MPQQIHWNKSHTKVKVWTTISDGWLSNYEYPWVLVTYPHLRDTVMLRVYRICPCCNSRLERNPLPDVIITKDTPFIVENTK